MSNDNYPWLSLEEWWQMNAPDDFVDVYSLHKVLTYGMDRWYYYNCFYDRYRDAFHLMHSGTRFSTWIHSNMERYALIERLEEEWDIYEADIDDYWDRVLDTFKRAMGDAYMPVKRPTGMLYT